MDRIDIHKPSSIVPDDYTFIACEYLKGGFGVSAFILQERERIQAHMAHTGGTYSAHEHGGNCGICGNVNALYTILYYHAKTNTYIRVGQDCAQKLDMSGSFEMSRFRKSVENVLQARAGKKKAAAMLDERGLSICWTIFEAERDTLLRDGRLPWEEDKVINVVSTVVRQGRISDAQAGFLQTLVKKLADRPAKDAQKAEQKAQWDAEKSAAPDCPTGRFAVAGIVIKTATQENDYGVREVMTVKDDRGFMVWCTSPRYSTINKGDRVRFMVTVNDTTPDKKMGFGKRPTMQSVESPAPAEVSTAATV